MQSRMLLGLMMVMVGCAAEPAEDAGEKTDALSRTDAYESVIAARRFKSGHLACGRTLTVTASFGKKGVYALDIEPCGDDGEAMHSEGHFEVIGGWLGGLVTNPTMKMTPSDDTWEPWSFEIAKNGEAIWLTDRAGTLVPEGMLD